MREVQDIQALTWQLLTVWHKYWWHFLRLWLHVGRIVLISSILLISFYTWK